MLSVIIAADRPHFLGEAVASVLDQTLQDCEVVVAATAAPTDIPQDRRVRVVESEAARTGALKRFAFRAAHGDVLVELEQDDVLAPDALARIADTLRSAKADFVYSNFAVAREPRGEPVTYSAAHGWRHRDATFRDRPVKEMIAFEPTPASLAHVWYAPNHVRAWTRAGYDRAGGHDERLNAGEDHDLLVRTYLSCRMARIDACLYLQRDHAGASHVRRGAEIRQATRDVFAASIEALVLRGCRLSGLPAVDLAPPPSVLPGWTAPPRADLRAAWPWTDSSVGAFRAVDVLHRLPDRAHTMSEIYRCLAPGGWLLSSTPSALGPAHLMDPLALSGWVRQAFACWSDRAAAARFGNTEIRFQEQRLAEVFPTEWHERENAPYVAFDGVALKPGYEGPGPR